MNVKGTLKKVWKREKAGRWQPGPCRPSPPARTPCLPRLGERKPDWGQCSCCGGARWRKGLKRLTQWEGSALLLAGDESWLRGSSTSCSRKGEAYVAKWGFTLQFRGRVNLTQSLLPEAHPSSELISITTQCTSSAIQRCQIFTQLLDRGPSGLLTFSFADFGCSAWAAQAGWPT